ncbi:RNA-binding motif protein, X-linked 2 [Spodoptera litura]|uniref:RNA-binding motif protein, X-linked 2 n=1 Tax=Spodoptera litura TaxID=69820 RepID=A0A9J7E7J6_SPOLT|nr:RNA-binding motif protein, X-linked 2 [Spodoptera litura]
MNPMTNMKNVLKLSERELGSGSKSSWHDQYKHSAWIFIGGLPYDLTEGDVICVFSQYGEIVNINLVRDKGTGKSKGFAFICYEDQRSTVLAVDNLNGLKILNRTIRVDHCEQYRAPNADMSKVDDVTASIRMEGCAPLIARNPEPVVKKQENEEKDSRETVKEGKVKKKKDKKSKKKKEKKSKKKKKKRSRSSSSDSDSSD